MAPEFQQVTRRSGRITCSLLGWISAAGPGELVETPPRMNATEYVAILRDVVIPSVRSLYPVDEVPIIHLVQDNSSVHNSHETKDFFLKATLIS